MIPLKLTVLVAGKCVNNFYLVPTGSSQIMYYDSELCEDPYMKTTLEHDAFGSNQKRTIVLKVTMDGYLCSLFHYVLKTSLSYRTCFLNYLYSNYVTVKKYSKSNNAIANVNLVSPVQEMLDYKGNEIFEISCLERRELDHAMAWLSTLGGAFSALGDNIEKCATIAGKISVRQLEIALRLGDPFLEARCKLYIALSLIQRQKFKTAQELIQVQYQIATQGPIKDKKLRSMCLGIWAKLRYDKNRIKVLRHKKINSLRDS